MSKDSEIKISLNLNNSKKKNIKDNSEKNKKNTEEINLDREYSDLESSIEILNKHNDKLTADRKPRIGKTLHEVKKEKTEQIYKKNEKKIILNKVITTVIIIVGIIILYLFFEYAPILGIRLPTTLSSEIKVNIVSTDNDIYDLYNNELLIYSNHVISTYNKKGNKTWEYLLDSSFNPEIYIHGKYMAISNNSNGNIYLFNNKKEILNMKVDGKIEYVYMDDNGNMAIEYATNGYKKIIGVYDKNGQNKYNAYLEYTAIVDVKLLCKAEKLLITQANSNSFKIGCSVSLLDGTNEEKNMQQILNFDNNFIYSINAINDELFILLDDKIIEYNMQTSEQKELKEFNSSQILFISLMDKYYVSIEKSLDNKTSLYSIIAKDYNNVEISTINIENSPKFVVSSKNLNYCIYQDKLQVINKWGIDVLSKMLTAVPKDIIIFNDGKSAALIYTNEINIINL